MTVWGEGVGLAALVRAADAVARTPGRREKTAILAEFLAGVDASHLASTVSTLMGELRIGPLGVGYARLRDARPDTSAPVSTLSLALVESELEGVARESGSGSVGRKVEGLRRLLLRCTVAEQQFLLRLCFGELRQGALSGVMADAVAQAFNVPRSLVGRAYMLSGDLGHAAVVASTSGRAGLEQVGLRLMRPVEPMLASTSEGPSEALERHGSGLFEWKLDGARIQVHKGGDRVRVFTRNLREVTGVVPEIVEHARQIPANELVLDGEAIALRPDGRPEPFQVTMSRFGRSRSDPSEGAVRLTAFYFDLLYHDGMTLVDRPLVERVARLATVVGPDDLLPSVTTDAPDVGEAFLEEARAAGHEGVMVKDPASAYQAGRRGKSWLKVKPANTLDLVVLAVERGSGRRSGWLSNIHLGARDPEGGGFVMLGKTFKGMTDEVLRWQTKTFPQYATEETRHVLRLRPHFVAEIAFNEIQKSPRYPGGLALRFARLKGYRPDKAPSDADSMDAVRALYEQMTGEPAP
ncbi:MAG: ATP-dependent DNA ligase [Gemmatimonadota bacterium]|nr:ATP-dependent DNA ligase [Gemmatimonadota bacterium]